MRVLVWADVHFDLWRRADTNPFARVAEELATVDALIIAGDIADNPAQGWPGFFGSLEGLIDLQRVWVIPGNHDYYGWRLDNDDGLAAIARKAGANFAQKRVIKISGSRFLCCTLWTDFRLTGDPLGAMLAARRGLKDYAAITLGSAPAPLEPRDVALVHEDHLAWLDTELARPSPSRSFVITHHAPHPAVAGKIDSLSAGFASNLDSFIRRHRPHAWLFGHTHRWLDARIGGTLLRNVSLGYPHEVDLQHERALLLRGMIEDGTIGAG